MAQIVLQPKNSGGHYAINCTVNYTETNVNYGNNTSDVYFEVILSKNQWATSWTSYSGKIYCDVVINGVSNRVDLGEYNYNGKHKPGSVFGSGTVSGIAHNSDGTKTINISASITDNAKQSYTSGSASASSTMALTNIPRYANITSFSVAKRNETSFKVNYSVDAACDWAWYSTNNGASWNNLPSDGIITGLSPNTTYNCKLRVRRTDSQLTTESGTVAQTTYKQPTQSLASKTETSLTMNWGCDTTVNYVWYSIDDGVNWVAVGTANSTSGSYTINGLTANTSYNVKTRVRRSGVETTYDTANSQLTTHNYPYIKSVGTSELVIGDTQTLTIYNPLGRTITIKMNKDSASGTQLFTGTTSVQGENATYQFTPTESALYPTIPNSLDGNCVYSAIYGLSTKTTEVNKYKVKGTEVPTFENFAFTHSANYTTLTNDNKVVINNKSTITFKITGGATPQNNAASITKYIVKWGTVSQEITNIANAITLTGGSGNLLAITAYDSRNLNSTYNIYLDDANVGEIVNYTKPTASASTQRDNGVNATTYLKVSGNIFFDTFGSQGVHNEVNEIRYWVMENGEYSGDGYVVPITGITYGAGSGATRSYKLEGVQIHANGTSGGFPVGTSYTIKVRVKDANGLLDYIETTASITDGKLAQDTIQTSDGNYHHAINGLADTNYAEKIYGKTYIDGEHRVNGYDISKGHYEENVSIKNLPSGVDGREYWATLPNGVYFNNNTQAVANLPSSWGFVQKIGNTSGNGDFSILYFTQSTGNIYRKSGNYNSVSGWSKIGGSPLDAYPVGSIYLSDNATNPNTLFGGTWERLSGGFLYATAGSYGSSTGNGTNTGGPSNNTSGSTALTAAQSGLKDHGHSAWSDGAGNHNHQQGYNPSSVAKGSNYGRARSINDYSATLGYDTTWPGNHTHGIGVGGSGGSGAAEGHTHPLSNHTHAISYLGIVVWRRTA